MDKAYERGIVDLMEILGIVSGRPFPFCRRRPRVCGRAIIRDINPREFWDLPEAREVLTWSGLPAERIIFIPSYVNALDAGHPIAEMERTGLCVIRRPISNRLPIGFRLADAGNRSGVTLMRPNDDDPAHPWISRQRDPMSIAYILSRLELELAQGLLEA